MALEFTADEINLITTALNTNITIPMHECAKVGALHQSIMNKIYPPLPANPPEKAE